MTQNVIDDCERATHLRLAMDAGKLGSWEIDLRTKKVFCCGRMRLWCGLSEAGVVSTADIEARVHPLDVVKLQTAFGASGDSAARCDFEFQCRFGQNGDYRWIVLRGRTLFDASGLPQKVLGVVADVSERVLNDEALRRASELRARLFDEAPDTLLLLDLRGHPLAINRFGRAHLEVRDVDALKEQLWATWWVEGSREAAEAALRTASEGETARFTGRCTTQTGRRLWFSAAVAPILDSQGKPEQLLVPMRDVTAHKAVERQLQHQASFAQHLVAVVSHDLRNPVTAIKLSADHLARRSDLSETQQRLVQRVHTSADRAIRLIHDLLDLTQVQLGQGIATRPQAMDVHQVVQQIVDEVRSAEPKRHIRITQVGSGNVVLDADRVGQVISNLLSNALQYSPEDTPVNIESRRCEGVIRLAVHNAGDPIDQSLLARLFEPMQRGGRNDRRGLGLGLFIVKKIVEAHRGTIEVVSNLSSGTCFVVNLPLDLAAVQGL